jgi:hypothetical protein
MTPSGVRNSCDTSDTKLLLSSLSSFSRAEGAEQFLFGLLALSNVERVYQHVRLTADFDDVRGEEHGVEAAALVVDSDLALADDAIALQVVPESGPVRWVGPDAQFGGTFPNDFGRVEARARPEKNRSLR